jgi:alkanesulfonate monooxygenase SsuD/methylene tetrahydromethanopterin reductase-like flavin-dependent oxidoreductase (luciferase family)
LWVPLFGELSDPQVVARVAAEAEEAGWDGVFVWDHIRWSESIATAADPWITLAAIATATEQVRLGPMVTPLARRRPTKVARETVTLDRLSGGRLILGVGLGGDQPGGELSRTGEELDARRRADMLDESLAILAAAWSGEPVRHHGEHYTVDDIQFLPRPVQEPGIPVWTSALTRNLRPLRRAARHDGVFVVNLEDADQLAETIAIVTDLRGDTVSARPFDVVVGTEPGVDPEPYVKAGATWWMADLPPESLSLDQVRGIVRDGPLR